MDCNPEVDLLLSAKQFVPAFSLRVTTVLNLQPALPVVFVDAQFLFCDDALQVATTQLLEESFAILLKCCA